MANPSWLLSAFPYMEGDFLPVAKGIVGGALWSFLILWLVLRLVRMFQTGDTQALLRYLRAVLYALCLLFDAAIALSCASALRDSLSASRQGRDGVRAVLRFLASALPYGLDIFVTLSLFRFSTRFLRETKKIPRNMPVPCPGGAVWRFALWRRLWPPSMGSSCCFPASSPAFRFM